MTPLPLSMTPYHFPKKMTPIPFYFDPLPLDDPPTIFPILNPLPLVLTPYHFNLPPLPFFLFHPPPLPKKMSPPPPPHIIVVRGIFFSSPYFFSKSDISSNSIKPYEKYRV